MKQTLCLFVLIASGCEIRIEEEPAPFVYDELSRAVFNTTDCGAMPMLPTAYSNDVNAPAALALDTIVEGRIDPESTSNQLHYWAIELEPGDYHVVLDEKRADRGVSNIGMNVHQLGSVGEDLHRFIASNEIEKRIRSHAFFTVNEATLVGFKMAPSHDAEDYYFGIFSNQTAVPTPAFFDCPPVADLSMENPIDFELAGEEDPGFASDTWFYFDSAPADYRFTVDARRVDGEDSNFAYIANIYRQFGQEGAKERIFATIDIGLAFRTSEVWPSTETAPVMLRINNIADDPMLMSIQASLD